MVSCDSVCDTNVVSDLGGLMNTTVRATIRIPTDIADWLRGEAKRQNRSLNRQLTEYLKAVMASTKNEQA